MSLIDELGLRDDENILSNKQKVLKIGEFIEVEAKTRYEIPNNGFKIADIEMETRKLMQANQIFKAFSDKMSYIICPDNPTFHEQNYVHRTKTFQSLNENLTNITFWGRKETPVTSTSIISKFFELKHAHGLMGKQLSQLGEEKSASVSQGRQKNWKDKYT